MADLFDNPLGTDGFECLEYTGDANVLDTLFRSFGFTPVARHKTKDLILYRQGRINFILNREQTGQGAAFAREHKGGVNALGFRVKDSKQAFEGALKRGAKTYEGKDLSFTGRWPALQAIGGAVIYLIDDPDFYESEFEFMSPQHWPAGAGLTYIDHVTHNVHRGNMDVWAKFYEDVFNFREIRYFDIEGKLTGLKSKAMTSPCGKIRIPHNESSDDKSQIKEFLDRFNGEGIQHIALGTDDIYGAVEKLRGNGVPFQKTPDTYFEKVNERVKGHKENLDRLRELNILIDGAPTEGQGLLLQIFTQDAIGPVFFELIQRKGNEGFGEGNFKALFESIELDQIRRGVLKDDGKKATG